MKKSNIGIGAVIICCLVLVAMISNGRTSQSRGDSGVVITLPDSTKEQLRTNPEVIEAAVNQLLAGKTFDEVFPKLIPTTTASIEYEICADVVQALVSIIQQEKPE